VFQGFIENVYLGLLSIVNTPHFSGLEERVRLYFIQIFYNCLDIMYADHGIFFPQTMIIDTEQNQQLQLTHKLTGTNLLGGSYNQS